MNYEINKDINNNNSTIDKEFDNYLNSLSKEEFKKFTEELEADYYINNDMYYS